jgi:uncharacterized membrane protein YgdD (TMEM256/DUF423 family)
LEDALTSSLRSRLWLGLAGLSGGVAVATEALARHGLDAVANAQAIERLGIAARYQELHALALIAVLILADRATGRLGFRALVFAGWAFLAGLVLFGGTLDVLAAGAPAALTALVPIGGSAFILGWLALALAGLAGNR